MKVYIIIAIVFFILGSGASFKLSAFLNSDTGFAQDDKTLALVDHPFIHATDPNCQHMAQAHNTTDTKKPIAGYSHKSPADNHGKVSVSVKDSDKVLAQTVRDIRQYLVNEQPLSSSQWTTIKSIPGISTVLLQEYGDTYDPEQRKKLEVMMRNLSHSDRLEITNKLIHDANENDQRLAYALLRRNPTAQLSDSVASSIVYNLYQASSPEALIDNLSVVRQVSSPNIDTHGVLSHINQLTQHDDSAVRAKALSTLSYMDSSQQTLGLVINGLDDENPAVRRAAATALFNYDDIDEASHNKLIEISSDFSEDSKVREEILAYLGSNE